MARLGLQRQTEAEIALEFFSDLGVISDGSPVVRDDHGSFVQGLHRAELAGVESLNQRRDDTFGFSGERIGLGHQGLLSCWLNCDATCAGGEWSRSPLHLDHPIIAITRAYQCARNNWNFDPQGIERSSDAGGMDSLDTCNPCFQLNHVWGFQLRSIAHISHSGADLQRQCELGDVDVTIDITLTLAKVGG